MQYTEAHPFEEGTATGSYTLEDLEGNIMIASDADVDVIAAFASKLVLDSVLEREPSNFPYSLYLIGLKKSWVFSEPLHNIPIDTDYIIGDSIEDVQAMQQAQAYNINFIKDLLEKMHDSNTSAK